MQAEPEQHGHRPDPGPKKMSPLEPDFSRPIKPIAEFLSGPDFPQNAVGEFVDIGGYSGVVVQVVSHSVKVRSPEGVTRSFNVNRLRAIYGPVLRPEPMPERPPAPPPFVEKAETPAAPPPTPTLEPDFTRPLKKIAEMVSLPDFPACALGEHIEIGDYRGVVVQIVNRSLKVRSEADTTRSYNADALRKLHKA